MQDQYVFLGSRRPDRDSLRRSATDTGMIDFAAWVVALLAARKSTVEPVLRADLLAAFHHAAIQETPAAMEAFLRDLVRQKVPATTVADLYIPALARQLGEDWLEDRVTFLQVTLGSSRMQAMLRALGTAWTADLAGPGRRTALLLVVPREEQHTLGAMVLLGQLRRMGVSVRLAIAPEMAELHGLLTNVQFQAALISASSMSRLAEVRRLVDAIRRWGPAGMVIAVGGHILQADADVRAATGADLATADPALVLGACAPDGSAPARTS